MRIEELEDGRRLELLINGVVDYAIYTIDLEGNIVSWNSGAERLKGYLANEIIGRPFRIFFTSEDQDQGLPQRALSIAATEGRFESEGWRIRKYGMEALGRLGGGIAYALKNLLMIVREGARGSGAAPSNPSSGAG